MDVSVDTKTDKPIKLAQNNKLRTRMTLQQLLFRLRPESTDHTLSGKFSPSVLLLSMIG